MSGQDRLGHGQLGSVRLGSSSVGQVGKVRQG